MKNILKEHGQVISDIDSGIARLLERKKILEEEKETLLEEVKYSRIRVDNKKPVEYFLEKLQIMEHEKSLGAYEDLLTSFLNEVLPGKRKVVLDLKVTRQTPALNVYIEKSPGKKEDVLTGTGGSVTNIIVAGLRIIALLRSSNRKFLVLDEPDCWLEESNIPNFVKVIDELAKVLGIQIFLVSHSKLEDLSSIEHQVTLYQDENKNGQLETSWDKDPVWEDGVSGIKSIHLKNFQAHADTFIPLSPGVTLFKGKNDIGKSAVVSALRAIFYGNGDDTNVRHDTSKAEVSIEFSDNKRLLIWERKKTGSPKEIYTMYDVNHSGNNPLHRTESASKIPDWLPVETGIGMVGDLDLQLAWQKNPISILGEKPNIRAQALAVGDEADYVQKMMSLSASNARDAARTVKEGEIKLENIRLKLLDLKNVGDLAEENKTLKKEVSNLIDIQDKVIELNDLYSTWYNYNEEKNKYSLLEQCDDNISIPNGYLNIRTIKDLYERWNENIKLQNVLSQIKYQEDIILEKPIAPEINNLLKKWSLLNKEYEALSPVNNIEDFYIPNSNHNIKDIRQLIKNWEFLQKESNILKRVKEIEDLENINKKDNSYINNFIKHWDNGLSLKEKLLNEINILSNNINVLTENIEKEFPVCPTCHKPWTSEHVDDINEKSEEIISEKKENIVIEDNKGRKTFF